MSWLGADIDRLHSFGLALHRLRDELVVVRSADPRVARALHLVEADLDRVRRTWHQLSYGRMAAVEFDAWGADGTAWWVERFVTSSSAADSILNRVIAHSAEQSFADRIRADVALLHGVSDFAVVADFWTRATDPSTVPVDVAGTRIRRLLDAMTTHRADRSIFTTLAAHQADVERRERDIDQLLALVIAPWSLHFTSLASEWNWTPQEGLHRLQEMLAIPVVASAVAAGLPMTVDRALSDLPDDEFARRRRIDDVAAGSGATIDAVGAAVLGRSATPLDRLDDLVALVPWGSWASGVAAGTTAATLVHRLDHRRRDQHDVARDGVARRSALATVAMTAVANDAVKGGRIGSSARRVSNDLAHELERTRVAFDSAADRGGSFVQSGGTSPL